MEAERGFFSKVEKDEVVHGLFRVTATVQEKFREAPSLVTTPSSRPSVRADEPRIPLERFLGSVSHFFLLIFQEVYSRHPTQRYNFTPSDLPVAFNF